MASSSLTWPKLQWRYAGPWLGIATAPAALMLGGGVAQQTPFDQIPLAIGLGVLVLWLLSTSQGRMGATRRRPLVELARPVLGTSIARWTNTALIAVLMMGWAGFSTGVAGGSLAQLFAMPEIVGFIVWAVLMFFLLWSGIHFGSLIALLGSLATLMLMVWGLVQVNTLGQVAEPIAPTGTVFSGLSLIIGYGSAFSLRCVDFTQAIHPRHVVWMSMFGLAVPLALVCFSGAWLYNAAGTWDLSLLLNLLGFPLLANAFIVIGFLGAGISNMHSGSLALEDLFRCKRILALAIVSIVSIVLALLEFEQGMVVWFQFLSVVVVPLIGVMLTHYGLRIQRVVDVNKPGLIAWVVGAIAGVLTPHTLPKALVGIVVAALIYGLINVWLNRQEEIS
jgi:purine-cytosine permease-like protein